MKLLGIDIGTSSVKAAVLDAETAQVLGSIGRAPYLLDHPSFDAAEVPVDRVWGAVVEAVRPLAARGGLSGICGIGLSCMMPALVLLDDELEPLFPAWTHLDRRSLPAAKAISKECGSRFHAFSGNLPLPGGMSAVAFRQILSGNPDISRRVSHYLHLNGWIGFQLTGELAFDSANASFTGLYSTVASRNWSQEWLDYFGVRHEWLPRVISGDETLGGLKAEAAHHLGLPAGLPVKLGTADTSSALLLARLRPGELLHGVGTTQVLAAVVPRPLPGDRRLVRALGVGDAFVHVTHNPLGGAALDWMHKLCFSEMSNEEFYADALQKCLERATEVILDPPFLGGDRLELEPCFAGFSKLSLRTSRRDLLAALVQAMRRGHLQAIRELGVENFFTRVVLSGGGARAVQGVLPAYPPSTRIEVVEEASLTGIARLFIP